MDISAKNGLCFTTRESPGYLIRRAAQLLVPQAEALFADRDLTLSQWISLKMIRDGVADTSSELARRLGHNSGATTRMIDQLEERGLVRRHRSTEDRRVVTLELTRAGHEATAAMGEDMMALWRVLLQDFAGDEIDTLISLLSRLVDRLEMEESG